MSERSDRGTSSYASTCDGESGAAAVTGASRSGDGTVGAGETSAEAQAAGAVGAGEAEAATVVVAAAASEFVCGRNKSKLRSACEGVVAEG